MLDAAKWKARLFVSDLLVESLDRFSRRSRRLTQMTTQRVRVIICVICVICGQNVMGGRKIRNPKSEIRNSRGVGGGALRIENSKLRIPALGSAAFQIPHS
jgi:hypothetical protein